VVNTFQIAGMFDELRLHDADARSWAERDRTQAEIADELRPKLQAIPGVEVFMRQATA
jgi:hypothetical protein